MITASGNQPMATHPLTVRIMDAKRRVTPGQNIDPMFTVQAPGMLAYIPGASPIAGEWSSREALAAAGRSLGERVVEGSLHISPHVVATDHLAINVQRVTAARPDGRTLDTVLTEVWRFRDGVCVELWDHFQDLNAWDAFWR